MNEKFEPIGWCWLLGLCEWWNPPEELAFKALKKRISFCINCSKFKEKKAGLKK